MSSLSSFGPAAETAKNGGIFPQRLGVALEPIGVPASLQGIFLQSHGLSHLIRSMTKEVAARQYTGRSLVLN
jgi:hypothetical protein